MAKAQKAQDSLTDGVLQSEIEMVGDLVVAATSSEGPLPQTEIDRLLGVEAGDEGGATDEANAAQEVDAAEEHTPEADR